jgi:plasmid maintenance system antidote protein VapI
MPIEDPQQFEPDWVSAPGVTITDLLAERKLSSDALAERLGRDPDFVTDLLTGRAEITPEIASKLHALLGASSAFWLSRERRYRDGLTRFLRPESAEVKDAWLHSLPVKDMLRFRWLAADKPSTLLDACFRFFAVSSVNEWKKRYGNEISATAFRTSSAYAASPASVAAWLRQGEIEAAAIECAEWDRVAFEKSFPALRALTRAKSPSRFMPQLRQTCAECGVALVVVPAPKGCPASGAARFLGRNKALIQLSYRYRTDDHFWFTFFHEAGHLVKHADKGMLLDGIDGVENPEEAEANHFAQSILLSETQMRELLRMPITYKAVIRFAMGAGIAPGIVVGQLQHAKKLHYSWLRRVKRSYNWEEISD